MFKVVLHKSAAKKLKKLPKDLRDKIVKGIELLSLSPLAGKKLHGELNGSRRLRIGDFRIVYDFDEKENTIIIHAIGSRGDVYK